MELHTLWCCEEHNANATKKKLPYDHPADLPFEAVFTYLSGPAQRIIIRQSSQGAEANDTETSSDWGIRLAVPLQPRMASVDWGSRRNWNNAGRIFSAQLIQGELPAPLQLRYQCLGLKLDEGHQPFLRLKPEFTWVINKGLQNNVLSKIPMPTFKILPVLDSTCKWLLSHLIYIHEKNIFKSFCLVAFFY